MYIITLQDVIDVLESLPRDTPVRRGFDSPHSYRGYYDELSFAPCGPTTVAQMLSHARDADGATYYGWKGGEFTMRLGTPVHLAAEGCVDFTEDDGPGAMHKLLDDLKKAAAAV